MAAKSNYLKGKIVEEVLRNVGYTPVATVYLALYTSNPTVADTGTEVTGGSYARQAVTFGAHSGGAVSNTGEISFTALPAATITHFGIRDASTAGNLLYFGALSSAIITSAGSEAVFAIGDIDVSES